MGRTTGCSGRWENRFDFQSVGLSFWCPALVTDKQSVLSLCRVPKGIKKSPGFFPPGLQVDCLNLGRLPQMLRRYPKAQITQERASHCPKNTGRCPKKSNSDRPSSKNCSLNRDVDCPSVGTSFGS